MHLNFITVIFVPALASLFFQDAEPRHARYSAPSARIEAARPDSVILANESFPRLSKFELDLFFPPATTGAPKTQLWFSIETRSTEKIADGTYHYSSKNVNHRKAFRFYGAQITGDKKNVVTGGSFTLKTTAEQLSVAINLTLADGTTLKSSYIGKYKAEDWRTRR